VTAAGQGNLLPYLPRLVTEWLVDEPSATVRILDGSVVFVDISGFTALSERLARQGKVGAELVTERLDTVFASLLAVAYERGGGLLKFGGDALLLWFEGNEHAARACSAASAMRRALTELERVSEAGRARLRMSVGVNSGLFNFFLVGASHRELLITGPAATTTVQLETAARAGEIVIGPATANAIPGRYWGDEVGPGVILKGTPPAPSSTPVARTDVATLDVGQGVPLAIRDHVSAGGHEPDHRQATIAFLHFGGLDGYLLLHGPEPTAAALAHLVRVVQHAADAHRVTFLGSDIAGDGGKIILAAGAPRATGDHEERMLLTLRQVRDAAIEVPIRMGVTRGHVFAGDVGFAFRRTYTVMGDTVNLAARLMAAAHPGRILASPDVLEHARARFQTVPVAPFTVKGKAEPVHASEVGELMEAASDTGLHDVAFVGREWELAELRDALAKASEGHGRAVRVVGPPGMGKSRFVQEVTAGAQGFAVIDLRGRMYAASTAYFVVKELLRDAAGEPAGDVGDLLRRLSELVTDKAPEESPWLPLIGAVLDVPIPDTPETAALDPRFRAGRLAALIVSLLDLLLDAPAVIVAEDAHLIDDASTSVLRALAEAAAERRWLVVCVRRELVGGFDPGEGKPTLTIDLPPLEDDCMDELVELATEHMPLSPHEMTAVAEKSGGNPQFLMELIRAVRTTGAASLPGSIDGVITARIDALPADQRNLLRVASVLGDSFGRNLLEALLAAEQVRLEPHDRAELEAEFFESDDGEVRFRQTLIRDAAYEGLPFRRRRDLHAGAGALVLNTAQASSTIEANSELLALHFFHAQAYPEAWRFTRTAGMRAKEKFANVEAARFFADAVESAQQIPAVDPPTLAGVYESLGDATERLGDFPRAQEAYHSARDLLEDPVARAGLMLKEAWIPERLGNFKQALHTISRAQHALGRAGRSKEVAGRRAQLSAAYAAILQATGRSGEAIKWCRKAIDDAQAAGDDDALAHAYSILSWALSATGRPDHIAYAERALTIYEGREDLPGQALVLNYLGGYAYFDGRWSEAVEFYERGRAARERTGDAVNAAYGVLNIGEILLDQGHVDEARQRFASALRVWRAAGHRWGVAAAQTYLGRAEARAGQFERAFANFDEAKDAFRDLGEASLLEVEVRIAEAHLLAGDADAAFALSSGLVERAGHGEGVNVHLPTLHRIRGWALVERGDLEAGRASFELSLEDARRRNAPYDEALALRAIAELAEATGRGDQRRAMDQARSILDRLGVVAPPGPDLRRAPDGAATTSAVS
jgi:class 3 adenylate cyclase/tetratricopeptide (TPR) repeat protein